MADVEKKQNKGQIKKKGPAILPHAVIHDIITNRALPKARAAMAAKHGISEARVNNLYREYYGGTTLADYKTGLKKPIPADTAGIPGENRQAKTPRGKYSAAEPKLRADARAAPRVIKKPIRGEARSDELELERLGDLPAGALNQQANIIAGQIQAGNNNADLVDAIHELIENNKLLSRATYENVLSAQQIIDAEKHKDNKIAADLLGNEERGTEDADDSTKFESPQKEAEYETSIDEADSGELSDSEDRRGAFRHGESRGQLLSRGQSSGHQSVSTCPPVSSRVHQPTSSVRRLPPNLEHNSSDRVRPTGNRARAQPISKISKRPVESDGSEEFGYSEEDSEYEQEIHRPQPARGNKRRLQPHNTHNNNKHDPLPGRRREVFGEGRNGSRTNIQVPQRPQLTRPI